MSKASKKKKVETNEERFSRFADRMYYEGTRYLVYIVGGLFAVALLYTLLFSTVQYESIDVKNDQERLKEVLTSGHPWVVLCRPKNDELPVGFVENLGKLGITKAAVVSCDTPLPQSGLSIMRKYKLNPKRSPVGFLTVGNSRTQLDPKLFTNEESNLGQVVRKAVGKHFSIKDIKTSSELRKSCATKRCVIWGEKMKYFGPATAALNPKWVHVRVNSSIRILDRTLDEHAMLVWPTKTNERFGLFLDASSKFSNDVLKALSMFEEDPAFATSQAKLLGFEWATTAKNASNSKRSPENSRQTSPDTHQQRPESQTKHERTERKEKVQKNEQDIPLGDKLDDTDDNDDEYAQSLGVDLDEL